MSKIQSKKRKKAAVKKKKQYYEYVKLSHFIIFILLIIVYIQAHKSYVGVESDAKIENLLEDKVKYNKNFIPASAPELIYEVDKKQKDCLIKNVFYEGPRYYPGMEKVLGVSKQKLLEDIAFERIKIINVTLNRVKSKNYPDTVCDVVYQHKQFSWTLDKSKLSKKSLNQQFKWDKIELDNIKVIEKFADRALGQGFEDLTKGAMYYHTHAVDPYWSGSKKYVFSSRWHKYYKPKVITVANNNT